VQSFKRVLLYGALFAFILAVLALPAAAADLSPISDFGPGEPGLQSTFRQSARVSQVGANNRLDARQSGGAQLLVEQQGDRNSALTQQAGRSNHIELIQVGNGNFAGVDQLGQSQRAQIAQYGNANTAEVIQARRASSIQVKQVGNGMHALAIAR
jgi:minor curlin subunit